MSGRIRSNSSKPPVNVGSLDEQTIRRFASLMFEPEDHIELRAIPAAASGKRKIASLVTSGHNVDGFVSAARALSRGPACQIYYTLNPTSHPPGCKSASSDHHIRHRRNLLIDIDPVRPTNTSASQDEKAKALDLAKSVYADLNKRTWPDPMVVDSGNGYHLLYRIDLPNDDDARLLVQNFLHALSAAFSNDEATIDTCVSNASRIAKLPGSWSCKGTPSEDRPHRRAKMMTQPENRIVVDPKLLREFCQDHPTFHRPTSGNQPRGSACDILERAGKYLDTIDPAVQGQYGSNPTFWAARVCCWGFALDEATALQLLLDRYNPRCRPPWSPEELEHKIRDATVRPFNKPFGWLLHDDATHRCSPPRRPQPSADRVVIVVSTHEHEVNDTAIEALAGDPDLFQQGGRLVRVCPPCSNFGEVSPPQLDELKEATLRERLSLRVDWRRAAAEGKVKPCHPPVWALRAILERRRWPGIRELTGIVQSPTLCPDGRVLEKPGWDRETGLLYTPQSTFPPIPSRPDLDRARQAGDRLLDLVCDFPFAFDTDRAAWLACLLTVLARPAISGPTPLFLFGASSPGSGKTLLAELIGLIVQGRPLAVSENSKDPEEMRKTVSSILLKGERLVLLDNVQDVFGCSALDAVLTSTSYSARLLGQSQRTPELPNQTIWLATGNNFRVKRDTARRVVPCRLVPQCEYPELRCSWKYPDLKAHVLSERSALVVDALTILLAHQHAGRPRPDPALPEMGSYTAWSQIVREAVYWTIGIDPCAGRLQMATRAMTDENADLAAVFQGWSELPQGQKGLTAAKALKLLEEKQDDYQTLREALRSWSVNHEPLPNSKTLGDHLRRVRDCIAGQWRLVTPGADSHSKVALWAVEPVQNRQ